LTLPDILHGPAARHQKHRDHLGPLRIAQAFLALTQPHVPLAGLVQAQSVPGLYYHRQPAVGGDSLVERLLIDLP